MSTIIGRIDTVILLYSKIFYLGEWFKNPDKSTKVIDPLLK